MDEVTFTFMLEAKNTHVNLNDIASTIVDNASDSILECVHDGKDKKPKLQGVFLMHFPSKVPLVKVNDCTPISEENSCMVFNGRLVLGSNQIFTQERSDVVYSSVEEAVNTLGSTLIGEVAIAKYLGPNHTIHNVKHSVGDQVLVGATVLFSIPLIFLIYKWQRKLSNDAYRRVTFAG